MVKAKVLKYIVHIVAEIEFYTFISGLHVHITGLACIHVLIDVAFNYFHTDAHQVRLAPASSSREPTNILVILVWLFIIIIIIVIIRQRSDFLRCNLIHA